MRQLLAFGLIAASAHGQAQRVVHVVVALCDNVNQGIVPVPAALGNGQDPGRNLYWGAAYGVRTWFDRSADWERMQRSLEALPGTLERVVWKHRTADVYLVADAYDGARIQDAIYAFLSYAGGHEASSFALGERRIPVGGAAHLLAYCGHDGLMEFAPPPPRAPANAQPRDAIVLACASKPYFDAPLRHTGSRPLLWTTGLMAPEAYTLDAALQAWVKEATAEQVRERAAEAYAKWQKCGLQAARRLLISGR
jgi:hypothetical protein